MLLYGAPNTGKTSLCQAVAHAAGANFFDLSPRNTDAKYPGKAVALMIHMVCNSSLFTLCPSVQTMPSTHNLALLLHAKIYHVNKDMRGQPVFLPFYWCAVSYMEADGLHVHVTVVCSKDIPHPLTLPCFSSFKPVSLVVLPRPLLLLCFNSVHLIH